MNNKKPNPYMLLLLILKVSMIDSPNYWVLKIYEFINLQSYTYILINLNWVFLKI